ncbi:MAG: hypothetical protein ACT4P2_01565 [Pseudomonadota bacterium]
MMRDAEKFAVLRRASRVWAVASIHGAGGSLARLHGELGGRFRPGDRLVYLGNYFGLGPGILDTVDELLRFRREIIAGPRMFASDVVYLRGSQEEMWHKLLQLQLAVNPGEVLEWMLRHGAAATIAAYGGDAARGRVVAREGARAITRWTSGLRAELAARPGHQALMSALKRAAWTEDGGLLFVHAGLDPTRPLAAQGDALWWGSAGFRRLDAPYEGFKLVVYGWDRAATANPLGPGPRRGAFSVSIDGGCGRGGKLVAACVSPAGDILDAIEA